MGPISGRKAWRTQYWLPARRAGNHTTRWWCQPCLRLLRAAVACGDRSQEAGQLPPLQLTLDYPPSRFVLVAPPFYAALVGPCSLQATKPRRVEISLPFTKAQIGLPISPAADLAPPWLEAAAS